MAASSSSSCKGCDIFLSHSGSQKLFTQILHEKLTQSNHMCFFDQDSNYSLRKGDHLEGEIVKAIEECKLAVVVISREFITSFWPMLELQYILDKKLRLNATNSDMRFRVYPIFYKLDSSDLTKEENLQLWKKEWERIVKNKNSKRKQDEKPTNNFVEKWANALADLRVIVGSILPPQHTNEYDFVVKEVFPEICKICPAPRFYFEDDDFVKGKEAWIKEMDDTFKSIKDQMSNVEMGCKGVMVIGVHGIGGCGKSTLCKVMLDVYTQHDFPRMCACLLLPTPCKDEKTNKKEFVKQLKKAMKNFGIPRNLSFDDIDQAVTTFNRWITTSRKKIFLAIDNVWSWNELYVRKILQSLHKQGPEECIEGVKLIVTSRSAQLLQQMFQAASVEEYCYKVVPIPSITKKAALDTLLCYSGNENLNKHNKTLLQKVNVLVEYCFFNGCYYPLVMKAIASKLIQINHNKEQVLDECIEQLKNGNYLEAQKFEEDDALKLLRSSFEMLDKNLQGIFLDITLHVCGYKVCIDSPKSPLEGISMLYDDCNVNKLTSQCERLEYLSFWKLIWDDDRQNIRGFEVHDLYVQLAKLEGKLELLTHEFYEFTVFYKYEVDGLSRTMLCFYHDIGRDKTRTLKLRNWYPPTNWSVFNRTDLQLSFWLGPQLRVLSLDFEGVESIDGLDAAPNLVALDVSDYLDVVPNLQKLRRLRWLRMTGNNGLKQFADLQLSHAKLERLNLSNCHNLVDLSGIAQHCPTLQYLDLSSCKSLQSLGDMLQHCPALQYLDLHRCRSLQSLGDMLQHCPALQYLDLSYCSNLNVPSIKLPSLKILKLNSCDFLEELMASAEPLHEQLPRLDSCAEPLHEQLPRLEQLCYSNCRHPLSVLPGLRGMSSLRILEIKINKLFEFGKFVNTIVAELNALAGDLINLKTLKVHLGGHFPEVDYEKLANYLDPEWSVSGWCLQFKRS